MGLVLKYVQNRGTGARHYRRAIPHALRGILGKSEIVQFLGDSDKEALRAYLPVHSAAEAMLDEARRRARGPMTDGLRTPLGDYGRLLNRLRAVGVDPAEVLTGIDPDDGTTPGEIHHRHMLADGILESYPQHPATGYALGMSEADEEMVKALNSGLPAKPVPMLADALTLYITERVKGVVRKQQRAERAVGHAKVALGGDRKLTDIGRSGAILIRNHLRDNLGVQPATAKRYLIDIRAITNLAIWTHELGVADPFTGVSVELSGLRREDREVLTEAEVTAIRARLAAHARRRPELLRIWTILEYTGCRLAEVSGIERINVAVDGEEYPHLKIRFQANRRLKNKASIRDMPLVPEALAAVREALAAPGKGPYLFPNYAATADAISAILMRHVRHVSKDAKVVTHSLRHRLKDLMELRGVPFDVREMALGHSNGSIAGTYGSGAARLQVMAEALTKTFTAAEVRAGA